MATAAGSGHGSLAIRTVKREIEVDEEPKPMTSLSIMSATTARRDIDNIPKSTHFTQSQLAVALAIQKSKPEDISTGDYCRQLRKHVKLGQPAADSNRRYIDSATFWKDQCARLDDQKRELEDEVMQLKQRLLHSNGARVEEMFESTEGLVPHVRPLKRFAEVDLEELAEKDIEACVGTMALKRKAQEDLEELAANTEAEAVALAHQLQDSYHASYLRLVRHAHSINKYLETDHLREVELLAQIKLTVATLKAFFKSTYDFLSLNSDHVKNIEIPARPKAVQVFRQTHYTCLLGLIRLCSTIEGRRCQGQVIYALVKLFTTMMTQFQELCVVATEFQTSEMAKAPITAPIMSLAMKNRILTSAMFLDEMLCDAKSLAANSCVAQVLEGFLSALVTRLGSLLSNVVFNDRVTASPLPGCIGVARQQGWSHIEKCAMEVEGWHLTKLLKRSKVRMENGDNRTHPWYVENRDGTNATTEATFLPDLRQKMQETLLKAVFGDKTETFFNALRMPKYEADVPTDDDSEMNVAVEGEFVEFLWSTMGWEAIMRFPAPGTKK